MIVDADSIDQSGSVIMAVKACIPLKTALIGKRRCAAGEIPRIAQGLEEIDH
jgi:hypothetical protein